MASPQLCSQSPVDIVDLKQRLIGINYSQLNFIKMNSVTLIGNAGGNPEMMTFEKSKKASFSLATNERFKINNEEKTVTSWHNVVAHLGFRINC